MPEEINRLVTDAIADLLWTPSPDADANLRAEGVPAEKIDCIGNIMIDSFEMLRGPDRGRGYARERLGVDGQPYAVVTLHRPSNVDQRTSWASSSRRWCRCRGSCGSCSPSIRARASGWRSSGCSPRSRSNPRIVATEPLGYIEFMNLVARCTHRGDGFGRRAGRNHIPRHSLRHAAREHRAAGHRDGRHEPADEAPTSSSVPCRPRSRASGRRASVRIGGMASAQRARAARCDEPADFAGRPSCARARRPRLQTAALGRAAGRPAAR